MDKSGNYIKAYDSIKDAEKSVNKRGIDSVLSKKTKTCGGFIWIYEEEFLIYKDEDKIEIINNANKNESTSSITSFKSGNIPWNKGKIGYRLGGMKKRKSVLQIDLNGNIVKEYDSIKDAASTMNCHQETIRFVCVGKNKTGKGFKWKYKINN